MAIPDSEVPLGARLGTWLGAFGWLIGFALVTIPDTFRFLVPMAGGAAVTLVGALVLDRITRHARRYLGGALCLTVAAIGTYWWGVMEPAVLAQPDVVARLAHFGASTHVPPALTLVAAVLGIALLLWAWRHPDDKGTGEHLLDVLPH
jgi:hypothetical protein